jgi:uncharacterized alpha-E superfamily protein
MLNRNAEALFWVGRYTERAENHARMIDVHYHIGHDSVEDDKSVLQWVRLLTALGGGADYEARHDTISKEQVLAFITLDRQYVNSLYSCISKARGNLRTLREKLPTELWDMLNGIYLWLCEGEAGALLNESPHQFLKEIKEWMAMFQGVAHSVMVRENEWHFVESGRLLERAENTLRILQSVGSAITEDRVAPYVYLQAVLKSVSGYQAFRRYYADAVAVEPIMELLLKNGDFPRSVQFSFHGLLEHLKGIRLEEQGRSAPHSKAIRLAGKAIADLACLEKEDIALMDNADNVLVGLMKSAQQIGQAMADSFFRHEEATA